MLSMRHLSKNLLNWCSGACVGVLLACPFFLQGCDFQQHVSRHSHSGASSMDCGDGVSLCGVLVLQSGLGRNHYRHSQPHVHGLWPETGRYGSSTCAVPSRSTAPPNYVHSCYAHRDERKTQLTSFQNHEWHKHGTCAGVASASDYFSQVCSLSAEPLRIMAASRSAGGGLDSMAKALTDAGYSIWRIEPKTGELLLSACSAAGQWQLSEPAAFSKKCGRSRGMKLRHSSLSPVAGSEMCVAGQHGPKCTNDSECADISGCLRCAHSGFCTQDPFQNVHTRKPHHHQVSKDR